MTYLPVSHLRSDPDFHREERFGNVLRSVSSFLQILAAAVRVSRAVEARREPAPGDLRTLGINGKLPKAW